MLCLLVLLVLCLLGEVGEIEQETVDRFVRSYVPICPLDPLLSIRASVDALCRDGAGLISRKRVQCGRLTRQGTTS